MGILAFFKNRKDIQLEEERLRSERIALVIKEGNNYMNFFSGVVLFPGKVEEYEQSHGYAVEIIHTERTDKGVTIYEDESEKRVIAYKTQKEKKFADFLIQQGLEALVNVEKYDCDGWDGRVMGQLIHYYYGLPIRRKPGSGPYR